MIYFAQLPTGTIKIGYSEDVDRRMNQLSEHYGCDLEVLCTMPGDIQVERGIHQRFEHLRFGRTEQFRPGPDLLSFIGKPMLVSACPDTVEAFDRRFIPVKIDRAIVGKAKLAATHQGISVAELLSDMLKAPVDRAYVAMLRELEKGTE